MRNTYIFSQRREWDQVCSWRLVFEPQQRNEVRKRTLGKLFEVKHQFALPECPPAEERSGVIGHIELNSKKIYNCHKNSTRRFQSPIHYPSLSIYQGEQLCAACAILALLV